MEIFSNYIRGIVFLVLTMMWHHALTHPIPDSRGLRSHTNTPFMIPTTKDLVYVKNDRIEISCEADGQIFWSIPKYENNHHFGSLVEIENLHKGVHRSNLIVHNATFADTGFYQCYCNSTDEGLRTSASTYVYVYDPKHLLTFWEHDVFNVYERNTTTLSWCRPTSPDVHVAIMLRGKTIVDSTHVSHPFTYDPRYGFTVENIYETIVEGYYVCKATDSSHVEYKMIKVKLTAPPFISIKTEKEFYKPDEPISIECHISSDSAGYVRLEWNNDKIVTKPIESHAVLTYNTTAKQSGKLYCIAQNKYGISYEVLKVFVTDLDKDCDVWEFEKNQSVTEGEQVILECGATKQKFNNQIHWYFNNSPLDTKQRPKDYKIVNYPTSYSHRSMLIIIDVKYANAGNYECRVENEHKSCGRIDVAVRGKPLLSCLNFDQNKTYENHEMIELQCSAVSNPLPSNVECIYEVADGTDEIPTIIVEFDRKTMTFNLTLSPYESGKIRCNATNEVGTSEMTLDVNVADVQYLAKYSNDTNVVVRNDSVIIPCRAGNPDVIIKLIHKDKEIGSSVSASSPYSYDPNVGFTIQNPHEYLSTSKIYCLPEHRGKSYPQQALGYKISSNPKIKIQHESHNTTSASQDSVRVEYNTMMTFRCIISSFSPIQSIDWYFIPNNSTEAKLNESLYTTTACNTKKDLCTESILKMPAHESGALRCEVSSDSKKYFTGPSIHVNVKETGMTYESMIIIALFVLILSIILLGLLFFLRVIRNRKENQKSLDTTDALITNNDPNRHIIIEIPPNESDPLQCEAINDSEKSSNVNNLHNENE